MTGPGDDVWCDDQPDAIIPVRCLTTENCALELISVDQYFGFPGSYALHYQHLRFKHIIEMVPGAHENQTIRQGKLQASVASVEFAHYGCRVQNSIAIAREAFQVTRQSAGRHSKRQRSRYEGSQARPESLRRAEL
jgi:hypothetical protein